MKNNACLKSVVILLSVVSFASSYAQSDPTSEPAKIIGNISDGRIQPTKPVKPKKQPNFKIHWSKVQYKNGQKFTINRVAPPVAVKTPPKRQKLEKNPKDDAQRAAELQRAAEKDGGTFMVYATIYDHRFTLVSWQHGGEKYRAISNIDFNHLNGFHSFEGRGKNYTMVLLTGNATRENLGKDENQAAQAKIVEDLTRLPSLDKRGPSYIITQGDVKNDPAMEFIEALHDLYAAEQPRLVAAYHARLRNGKIRAQHDAELRRNPPPKPDVTINFWKRDVAKERAEAARKAEKSEKANTQKGSK